MALEEKWEAVNRSISPFPSFQTLFELLLAIYYASMGVVNCSST